MLNSVDVMLEVNALTVSNGTIHKDATSTSRGGNSIVVIVTRHRSKRKSGRSTSRGGDGKWKTERLRRYLDTILGGNVL